MKKSALLIVVLFLCYSCTDDLKQEIRTQNREIPDRTLDGLIKSNEFIEYRTTITSFGKKIYQNYQRLSSLEKKKFLKTLNLIQTVDNQNDLDSLVNVASLLIGFDMNNEFKEIETRAINLKSATNDMSITQNQMELALESSLCIKIDEGAMETTSQTCYNQAALNACTVAASTAVFLCPASGPGVAFCLAAVAASYAYCVVGAEVPCPPEVEG